MHTTSNKLEQIKLPVVHSNVIVGTDKFSGARYNKGSLSRSQLIRMTGNRDLQISRILFEVVYTL